MRPFFAIVALATAACGGSSANINKPPEPKRKIEIKADIGEFSIPNGITGVVAPDPTTNTVVVAVRYKVGANLDPAGKAGLAHLVEHLMFQHRIAGESIAAHISDHAISYNAVTSYDTTDYYTMAPASALGPILLLEAQRLAGGCTTLTEEIFAREREVVRNEIRESDSGRGGDLGRRIRRAAFPAGHDYRRDIGGDDAQLMNITLADACTFIKDHYGPNNMSIVVTGGVTREQVGAALGASMGRVGRYNATPAKPAGPLPAGHLGNRHEIQADVDLPYAIVLFAMPERFTEERVAADMALEHALRRAAGMTDIYQLGSISRISYGGRGVEMSGVAIRLRKKSDAGEAFDAVWRAFGRADDYFSKQTYTRLKILAQTDVMRVIDSPWRRARALLEYHHADQTRYFFGDLDRIGAITRDRAKSAAKRVFSQNNAVAILVTPTPGASSYRRAAPSFVADPHQGSQTYVVVDPADAQKPMPLPVIDTRLDDARSFELENGIRVVLAPTSSSPLVQVRLIIAAGAAAEPKGKSGIADIAGRFLNANTSQTADAEIRAAVNFYETGGQWSVITDDDYTMFVATGLEMYVDHLIAGLERQIKAGTYDQRDIERWRNGRRVQLSTAGSRESLAASQALYAHTFGGEHPYATRGFPLLSDLGNLGVDAANDFRSRHYNGANTSLVISGKFDPALVEKYVRYHFGSWGRGQRTARVSDPAHRQLGSEPRPIAVAGTNDEVVGIDLTFPTPAGVGKDHAALVVLAEMLNDQAGGVRAELGASYGFSTNLVINAGPGMLHVSGQVDAARAGPALAALLGSIDGLRRRGAGFDAAFVLARKTVATRLLASIESTSGVGSRLAFSLRHGLPLDYDQRLATAVSQLTPGDVAAAIDRYLPAGRCRVMLTGTSARVMKAFADAGFDASRVVK